MAEDQIETGLSDLVYENPETLSPAKQITVTVNPPVPAVPLPPGFDVHRLSALARHVATNMNEVEEILAIFKLTPAQYAFIETIPFYKNALDTMLIEWNSPMSTNKRIAVKSAAIFEDGMIPLALRMVKPDETYTSQIEAAKMFAKVAGVGEQAAGAGSGEKFTIHIDLGGDKQIRIEKDVTPKTVEGSASEVPQDPQRK